MLLESGHSSALCQSLHGSCCLILPRLKSLSHVRNQDVNVVEKLVTIDVSIHVVLDKCSFSSTIRASDDLDAFLHLIPLHRNSKLMGRWQAVLEGSVPKQEVDDVAFVRLQPVQGTGWNRADVESVDVASIHQLCDPLVVVSDRGADQR